MIFLKEEPNSFDSPSADSYPTYRFVLLPASKEYSRNLAI